MKCIEQIHIPKEPIEDMFIWKKSTNSEFSVKSTYFVA